MRLFQLTELVNPLFRTNYRLNCCLRYWSRCKGYGVFDLDPNLLSLDHDSSATYHRTSLGWSMPLGSHGGVRRKLTHILGRIWHQANAYCWSMDFHSRQCHCRNSETSVPARGRAAYQWCWRSRTFISYYYNRLTLVHSESPFRRLY